MSYTINRASESQDDDIHASPGELVHKACRSKYTNSQQISTGMNLKRQVQHFNKHVRLRSSDEKGFHYEKTCLFCGKLAHVGTKWTSCVSTAFAVRTVGFKDMLLVSCDERDVWQIQ